MLLRRQAGHDEGIWISSSGQLPRVLAAHPAAVLVVAAEAPNGRPRGSRAGTWAFGAGCGSPGVRRRRRIDSTPGSGRRHRPQPLRAFGIVALEAMALGAPLVAAEPGPCRSGGAPAAPGRLLFARARPSWLRPDGSVAALDFPALHAALRRHAREAVRGGSDSNVSAGAHARCIPSHPLAAPRRTARRARQRQPAPGPGRAARGRRPRPPSSDQGYKELVEGSDHGRGQGTGLAPARLPRPSPMVPDLDPPVLGRLIRLLTHHGVTEAGADPRYLTAQIEEAPTVRRSNAGVALRYAVETSASGTSQQRPAGPRRALRRVSRPERGRADGRLLSAAVRWTASTPPFARWW